MFASAASNQDSWFAPAINESMAFYMSTNTFSNPIFGAQLEPDSGHEHEITADAIEQSQIRGQDLSRSYNDSSSQTTIEAKNNSSENNGNNMNSKQQNILTSFCDNLMFSIKSKIYVIELNFKRKLQRLKRYASGHLHHWLIARSDFIGRNGGGTIRNHQASGEGNFQYEDYDVETEEDKFWETIRQPYSKDSLDLQQEKILSRLEQVIHAKRSNSFYDFLEQQQQQQQQQQQKEGKLFNIGQPEFNARLRLNCSSDSHSSKVNNGKSGTKFGAGFSRVLNTTGICSQKLKDKHLQQQGLRRTTRGRQRVRNKWITGCAQIKRQAVCDLSSASEVAYFDEDVDDDDEQAKKLCIVCYTNQANIVTLPCKHHNTCSDCFIEIIYLAVKNSRYPLKCVLCRQKIERIRCSRRILLSVIEKNRMGQA